MNDNKNTWVTVLVVMATGMFAYFHISQQPVGEKQQMKSPPGISLIGDQNFPARLWEDPIAATERREISQNGLNDLRRQISQRREEGLQIQILGIFVDGFAYPEDREVRRRLRYAAQMAFACRDYKPADRNDLGSVSLPWPKGSELEQVTSDILEPKVERRIRPENQQTVSDKQLLVNIPFEWLFLSSDILIPKVELRIHSENQQTISDKQPLVNIPFEWFFLSQEKTVGKAVLVLWLKEQDFADFPLTRLLRLRKALCTSSLPPIQGESMTGLPAGCEINGQNQIIDFKIIGPRSLDMLERMDKDLKRVKPKDSEEDLKNIKNEVGKLLAGSKDPMCLACSRFGFPREEPKDDLLAKWISAVDESGINTIPVLLDELKLRGVDSKDQSNHLVAIFHEGDTLYGRACSQAFCKMRPLTRIYLRGLDGLSARRIEEETKPKNRESNSESSQDEKPSSGAKGVSVDHSEGDHQFDYARRMAEALGEECNGKSPKAIGIFGSDVGDKLILLKAMRKQFSGDTNFFTTELDDRYLDPSVLPDTRNLIVASTYPLDPRKAFVDRDKEKDKQELVASISKIPPFRDSTQTALFFACLKALGWPIGQPKTKIYVVGRKGFVESPDRTVLDSVNKIKLLEWVLIFITITAGLVFWERFFPSGSEAERRWRPGKYLKHPGTGGSLQPSFWA